MQKKVEKKGSKKEMITVQVKKEIMEKYERGMRVAEIAGFYNSTSAFRLQRERRKRWRNPHFRGD